MFDGLFGPPPDPQEFYAARTDYENLTMAARTFGVIDTYTKLAEEILRNTEILDADVSLEVTNALETLREKLYPLMNETAKKLADHLYPPK